MKRHDVKNISVVTLPTGPPAASPLRCLRSTSCTFVLTCQISLFTNEPHGLLSLSSPKLCNVHFNIEYYYPHNDVIARLIFIILFKEKLMQKRDIRIGTVFLLM